MKPQAFEYAAPTTVDEALDALTSFGSDAKVLAGGQSLLPLMNFRLARPTALVDIGRIDGLAGVTHGDGIVSIGSLTTHRALEMADIPGQLGRLIRASARYIGHYPIRVRGTFGGSLAHADPASEWCQLAVLLDATVVVQGPSGQRRIPAGEFLITVFTTALQPDEVITAVELPALPSRTTVNVTEFARRRGDFAIVSIMSAFESTDGVVTSARLCAAGVADRPVRLAAAEQHLIGSEPGTRAFTEAAGIAADEVDPAADLHGAPEFRRDLVRTLVRRCLEGAA